MPGTLSKAKEMSNLEAELYLLIAKFLSTGVCKEAAETLRKEIEQHQLLPKRIDWLGEKHSRSFLEFEQTLSQISNDHLLKICTRIGPILDKDIPPTVHGLQSLLGVGQQSLLRTKEDEKKPKAAGDYLCARRYGTPLLPSPVTQTTYPPNITKVLLSREISGPISSTHVFSTKMHARMQNFRRILGHLSSVYCVLFDKTGKYIFTGADDLLVKIWSATDGRLLASLRGHSAEITDMSVNYENTLIAAGSCDKTIRVWSLLSTAPVAVLGGHTAMVTSLQFCPYQRGDIRYLVSTGNDGCVCFWKWNPSNNIFNSKPLKFTERNKAGAQMICSSFSAGGVFLVTGSTDHYIRVYNVASVNGPEKILEREAHTDRVDSIQFSNSDCRFISGSKDGTAMIWKYERQNWHCQTLKMSTKLPGQPDEVEDTKIKLRVTMVGWTLDDSRVITAVSDFNVKVWDSKTGVLCHILKGHDDEVFVLEAHPMDPRVLLSSGHDGRISLWDLATGNVIKNYFNLIEGQGHGAVFDCKFSPDGQMFAATDSHGHLSIFGLGSNDRFKKVPEEQFFHTDYRPLIRDMNHYVLDEQTQTPPHLLPPPFLVDIDGNPYPPHLQRLVPGREGCNESQLVPYVAVSAEGDAEILEPVRPPDGNRRTIDDMIERLQQEQERNGSSPPREDPNESGSSEGGFSPRSNQRSPRLRSGDRSVSDPFSPRSAQRAQAGHSSRVGMRRTGDVEGVRQSVANWQSRGIQSGAPSWIRRAIVRRINPHLAKSRHARQVCLAESELTFFNCEKRRRSLTESAHKAGGFHSEKAGSRKQDVGKRLSRRLLLLNTRPSRNSGLRNGQNENEVMIPEGINFSSSTETEGEPNENWDDSSGEESSGSGEYSDWTADAGVNVEKRKSKGQQNPKPSTSAGTSTRPRRHVSSDDDDTDVDAAENEDSDEEEEDVEDSEEEEKENDASKSRKEKDKGKKKRELPNRNKRKMTKKQITGKKSPEWLMDIYPHRVPYVPQIGDDVVYFRQGHELYVQAVKKCRVYDISMRKQPWRRLNLRDQEVAQVIDLSFKNQPPRLVCLKLLLRYPHEDESETFVVEYHDMPDVIDFIVLKQYYDQAMCHNWKQGNRFRSAIDKAWWLGTIKDQRPFNGNYPDSMFQCFLVKWDNGEKEHMSPWDFEPIDFNRMPTETGGSVPITPEESMSMLYTPERSDWSTYGMEYDMERLLRGFARIMELSIAEPFTMPVDLNRFPSYVMVIDYPMDLGTIRARLENRFYRRLGAIKFDLRFIETNALVFNMPTSLIVKQAKCVVDLCMRFVDSSECDDPMILYQEMMEAKRLRSQDSQSELDALCSESDDVDTSSGRMKRRKRRERILQSNKRAKLEYTSKSWKSQCASLLDEMYQNIDSTPFREPVNLQEYPDYRDIVDAPMDLSTIKEKLETNNYSSPVDLCRDARLMFQNSRNYNIDKKSRVMSMTIRLSAFFEEKIRRIVSDWKSAVKYEEKLRNNQYVSNRRIPFSIIDSDPVIPKSAGRASTSMRRDDPARPGPSRMSHAPRYEDNSMHTKTKAKTSKDGGRISPKQSSSSLVKRTRVKLKLGNSLTNGAAKLSKVKTVSVKETAVRRMNMRVRQNDRHSTRAVPDDNDDDNDDEEEEEEDDDSDNGNENNSDNDSSDYDDKGYEARNRIRKRQQLRNVRELQNRLRPRMQNSGPEHKRPASLRIQQRNMIRQHVAASRRSQMDTRSTTCRLPLVPNEASVRPIGSFLPHRTRSMTVLSNKYPANRPKRESRRRPSTVTGSDGSESEEESSKDEEEGSSKGDEDTSHEWSTNSSNIQSTSKSSTLNDHSYTRENSYSDTESQSSGQEDAEGHNLKTRRSTRLTLRDKNKEMPSPSSKGRKPKQLKSSLQQNVQTRNRGQRTVRYGEDSDDNEDYMYDNSDCDNTEERVSISSRGRLRKLTRHGKALFSE